MPKDSIHRHVTTSGPMWAKYKRYGRKQLKSIYTILHGNQIESKASHKDFTRQNCWGDLVKSGGDPESITKIDRSSVSTENI